MEARYAMMNPLTHFINLAFSTNPLRHRIGPDLAVDGEEVAGFAQDSGQHASTSDSDTESVTESEVESEDAPEIEPEVQSDRSARIREIMRRRKAQKAALGMNCWFWHKDGED